MPLIQSKSKKALSENMEKEMSAMKPQKQSIAIAYNVQRKNKKKMAEGGQVKDPMPQGETIGSKIGYPGADKTAPINPQPVKKYAHGGEIEAHELMEDEERASSIADSILRKREAKKMAEGGMVDIEENGEEEPNEYNELDEMAAGKKELYDDSQISSQPMDSNEDGDSIDSDEHDMVAKIRSKMKMRVLG